MRKRLQGYRRWVIKIGSALLTNDGTGLDIESIQNWVAQMAELRRLGIELVLVSSGSVAAGMHRLGWSSRPKEIHELQAAAAVGQMGLIQTYESCFQKYGMHTAQILLTHDDLSNRQRYLNARSTLRTLVGHGVIPVVNENDTVVTDEIRFGDNDTLAALVANSIEAELLVLLTDQDGMYNQDPRQNSEAQLIVETSVDAPELDGMAGSSKGSLGRGGMQTKLRAARLAARSGTQTIIVGGRIQQVLTRLQAGEELGTLFTTQQEPMAARKQWLAGHLQIKGGVILDDGAVNVLTRSGKSLLPVGVHGVEGSFQRGEVVSCFNRDGAEVARGLTNYSSDEVRKIMGHPSGEISTILGYIDEAELIHRDQMVVLGEKINES